MCNLVKNEKIDVKCQQNIYHNSMITCYEPFDNKTSDYEIDNYFVNPNKLDEFIYTPRLRYGKYIENFERCLQRYHGQSLYIDLMKKACYDQFYEQKEKCQKGYIRWKQIIESDDMMSEISYYKTKYIDNFDLLMNIVKPEFRSKLKSFSRFGFDFILEPGVGVFNADPKSHFSERFFIQCEKKVEQKGQDIKEALNYMNDSPDYESLSWEYRIPGFEFHSKYQKEIVDEEEIQETKTISNVESCSPPSSGDLCGSESSKDEEKPDPTLCKDVSSKCNSPDFCKGSDECGENNNNRFMKAEDGTIGNYCDVNITTGTLKTCMNLTSAYHGYDVWTVNDIWPQKQNLIPWFSDSTIHKYVREHPLRFILASIYTSICICVIFCLIRVVIMAFNQCCCRDEEIQKDIKQVTINDLDEFLTLARDAICQSSKTPHIYRKKRRHRHNNKNICHKCQNHDEEIKK